MDPELRDASLDIGEDGRIFVRRTRVHGEPSAELGYSEENVESSPPSHRNTYRDQNLKLFAPSYPEIKTDHTALNGFMLSMASVFVSFIAIAIIGGVSHFRYGKSTTAQHAWTMTWLVFGIGVGFTTTWCEVTAMWYEETGLAGWELVRPEMLLLFYSAPSIGGFVVVAQMY